MDVATAKRMYDEASRLFVEKRHDEALRILDDLDAAYPNQKRVLYARAMALAHLKQFDEARALCDRLISEFSYPRAQELREKLDKIRPTPSSSARPRPAPADPALGPPLPLPSEMPPFKRPTNFATERKAPKAKGRKSPLVAGLVVFALIVLGLLLRLFLGTPSETSLGDLELPEATAPAAIPGPDGEPVYEAQETDAVEPEEPPASSPVPEPEQGATPADAEADEDAAP